MRIAMCSDEPYPVHEVVRALLEKRGHTVVGFGSIATGNEAAWADVAEQAALSIARGECDEGVFFCWSGTGISMAANKVAGIRAALCGDPGTARAARIWNHANVLCLSNRTLSTDIAKEIIEAWFEPASGGEGDEGVRKLEAVERRQLARRQRDRGQRTPAAD